MDQALVEDPDDPEENLAVEARGTDPNPVSVVSSCRRDSKMRAGRILQQNMEDDATSKEA